MAGGLIDIVKQVVRTQLDNRAHAIPSIKYGVVTAVSPDGTVSVRLDGETTPTPSISSLAHVTVGKRVQLVLFNRRLVVLGSIRDSDEPDFQVGEIGGRNLLKVSGTSVTNSEYPTRIYTMSEKMVPGETYTLRVWGSLGAGKSYFGAWLNGGSTKLVNLVPQGDGTYLGTFSGKSTGATNADQVYVYPYPRNISATSSITKVKLERGSVATDWTPAPEDYVERSSLLDVLYPVGSIYTTTSSATTCPIQAALGGTWVNYGGGRVLAGLDTTQTEFNSIGKTGGAKTHTLTTNQMPSHNHVPAWRTTPLHYKNTDAGWGSGAPSIVLDQNTNNPLTTLSAGGGAAHNNLQPYIVVRHWRRTA